VAAAARSRRRVQSGQQLLNQRVDFGGDAGFGQGAADELALRGEKSRNY